MYEILINNKSNDSCSKCGCELKIISHLKISKNKILFTQKRCPKCHLTFFVY